MVLSRSQIAAYEEIITEPFTKESFTKSISGSIGKIISEEMKKITGTYETKIATLENEIKVLKEFNEKLKVDCEEKYNKPEQYSRRYNLRVYGIKEQKNEKVEEVIQNLLIEKFNIENPSQYIDVCHRISERKANSDRPIIVKFISQKTKTFVYRSKSKLKGSSIIIREDLTYLNLKKFKMLSEEYGKRNVWTVNGVIFYKTEGTVKKVSI
ncbi:l1 transposable element-related [Holotrichia oblita]|uniref:L1 transposable element-related n=1 Tax=Holotrichia oblita TaxID=644536 RepID=A0ACB9TUF2_HOLOL|nr:l1 transposable element-related [Holotrichia oblita]